MSRSIWKPTYLHPQIIDQIGSSEIFAQNRASRLTASRVGRQFQVYNGTRWFQIEVTQERQGHRLGEFAPTRKRPILKKKKTVKSKK